MISVETGVKEKCSYKTPLGWNEFLTDTEKFKGEKNVPFYCLFLQHREKIPILLKYFCIQPELIIRVPTLQRKFVDLHHLNTVHPTRYGTHILSSLSLSFYSPNKPNIWPNTFPNTS